MKVLGYARVSTTKQDYEAQKEDIEKFCKNRGFELVDILSEKVTGRNASRPEWDRVLSAVENGRIDGVVFTRVDRVARSVKNLLDLIEHFEDNQVLFLPTKEETFRIEEYPISPQKRMIITVIGAIAEFEANLIRSRMEEGKDRAKVVGTKSGKPMNRPNVDINWKEYDRLANLKVPKREIARRLGIAESTLYKKLKERAT